MISVISPHLRTFVINLNFIMINARCFIFGIKNKLRSWDGLIFSLYFGYLKAGRFFCIYLKPKMRDAAPSFGIAKSHMEIVSTLSQIRKLFEINWRSISYRRNGLGNSFYK